MKYGYLKILLIIIIFSSSQLKSQTKATTEEGKSVLLYDNGTWAEQFSNVETVDCEKLIKEVSTTKTTGLMSVNPIRIESKKTSLTIELLKNENVIVVTMQLDQKDVCITPRDKIILVTKDGNEITLPSPTLENCKGEYTLFISKPWKNDELTETLSKSNLKSIQLKTYHFDMGDYQSRLFKKTISCLK